MQIATRFVKPDFTKHGSQQVVRGLFFRPVPGRESTGTSGWSAFTKVVNQFQRWALEVNCKGKIIKPDQLMN